MSRRAHVKRAKIRRARLMVIRRMIYSIPPSGWSDRFLRRHAKLVQKLRAGYRP